ncbi:MAG: hypothetical protein AAGA77_25535 [Bacteroidota bacterium]
MNKLSIANLEKRMVSVISQKLLDAILKVMLVKELMTVVAVAMIALMKITIISEYSTTDILKIEVDCQYRVG